MRPTLLRVDIHAVTDGNVADQPTSFRLQWRQFIIEARKRDLNGGDTFMEVMEEIPFQKIENGSLLTYFNKQRESRKVPQPTKLSDIEKSQLQKSIDFCSLLDFPVDKFPIHVTDDLSDACLGMAYAGEIYVARRTFMMGTKMVAATLIEEYIHIEKGFADCQYPMQNFLFEKLVSLGEQLIGEAL